MRDKNVSDLQIRYLGRSGFHLTRGDSSILIDPNGKKSGDLEGELVYCTHKHYDHISGVPTFLERNPEAILVSNKQVAQQFKKYFDRTVIVQDGDSLHYGSWDFEFIKGKHGLFRGILNLGVIVRSGDNSFGHCGDTVTFEGFSSARVKALAIPILGIVTTSPKRALSELKKFNSPLPTIILMHWVIRKPSNFCKKLVNEFSNAKCIVPEKGKLLPL